MSGIVLNHEIDNKGYAHVTVTMRVTTFYTHCFVWMLGGAAVVGFVWWLVT